MSGEYDVLQNISFEVIRFAFSRYYNNKPYLSDIIQKLQYYILKCAILSLNVIGYNISAEFLEHSLQENPNDIIITEGPIIKSIQSDHCFKEKINEIIKKYGNNDNVLKGIFGAFGNNLAMIGTSCRVVNEYKVIIQFKIENFEG